MSAMENEPKPETLLPLDGERVVTFGDRGINYVFYFSRITQADWEHCFAGMYLSSHNEGKQEVTVLDTTTPGIELVEKKLVKVDGYAEGYNSKPDWQSFVPPRHSRPAWQLLTAVAPSSVPADRFLPEHFEAVLDAGWGMERPGRMAAYLGLTHVFSPLTAEQKRRYSRATSETRVIGDRKHGRTLFIPKQPLLLKIYDELILSVKGYALNGVPLADRKDIIREMDAYHKVRAAEQLFMGFNEDDDAGEEAAAA